MFGAEHSDRALKSGTAQGEIKSDDQQKVRFPEKDLDHENGKRRYAKGDHDSQGGRVSRVGQNDLAEALKELVVGVGEKLIGMAQWTNLPKKRAHTVQSRRKQAEHRNSSNTPESDDKATAPSHKLANVARSDRASILL